MKLVSKIATIAVCFLTLTACDAALAALIAFDRERQFVVPEGPAELSIDQRTTIEIDREGTVRLNGKPESIDNLSKALKVLPPDQAHLAVVVLVHPDTRNGILIEVRDTVFEAGLELAYISFQPE